MISHQQRSYIAFIRAKIKDAEREMDYLGRCFSALDNKPSLTSKDAKEIRRVLKKIRDVNFELMDLWSKEEEAQNLDISDLGSRE
jgi:hypothetical protein